MSDTVKLLETALENEAKLFLKKISELENEDLYEFIRRIALLEATCVPEAGMVTPPEEILHIVQNVKNIENAIEDFYVA